MSNPIVLRARVEQDEITAEVSRFFDVKFNGEMETTIPPLPDLPDDWGIGVIVGPSGAGKSTLMAQLGEEEKIEWDGSKSVASHFKNMEDATERLGSTGLGSIPTWLKPYQVLSTGEKFRADLARRLRDGAVIDEYTSVVDRNVAKAASTALAKHVKKVGLRRLVLVGCHYDVLEWLQPDWVYDLGQDPPAFHTGRYLRRPEVRLRIYHCERNLWRLFQKHHYLSHDHSVSARPYLGVWDQDGNRQVVAYISILSFPHPKIKRAWRVHRLVVLPEFQGLGFGSAILEAVGNEYLNTGQRYYLRTSNPKLVAYCQAHSEKWRKLQTFDGTEDAEPGSTSSMGDWSYSKGRPTTGFEYLGSGQTLDWEKRQERSSKTIGRHGGTPSDEDPRRCKAITKAGSPCKNWMVPGRGCCFSHLPEVVDAAKKGGEATQKLYAEIREHYRRGRMLTTGNTGVDWLDYCGHQIGMTEGFVQTNWGNIYQKALQESGAFEESKATDEVKEHLQPLQDEKPDVEDHPLYEFPVDLPEPDDSTDPDNS